ncbi:MAG: SH3 domain-containing protein [Mangrovicoccus sp.]|nr:SH3 domain-containing protein [Mangrovicoccus sp.]
MAIRLTLILAAFIYVVLRFGGGPDAPEDPQLAAPTPKAGQSQQAEDSQAASLPPRQVTPSPDSPSSITLQAPQELTAAPRPASVQQTSEQDLEATPAVVAPEAALPEGFSVEGGLGLSETLDLRDQINAALEDGDDAPPARPSLSNLVQTESEDAAAAPASDAQLAEVTASSVNLRGGPSTFNPVVGQVTRGDLLELEGAFSGGWSAVRHPETGETAYISSQFLRLSN